MASAQQTGHEVPLFRVIVDTALPLPGFSAVRPAGIRQPGHPEPGSATGGPVCPSTITTAEETGTLAESSGPAFFDRWSVHLANPLR